MIENREMRCLPVFEARQIGAVSGGEGRGTCAMRLCAGPVAHIGSQETEKCAVDMCVLRCGQRREKYGHKRERRVHRQ